MLPSTLSREIRLLREAGPTTTPSDALALFDEGRSALWDAWGFDVSALAAEGRALALAEITLRFVATVRPKDPLVLVTTAVGATSASIRFRQRIQRGDRILVEADARVICLADAGNVTPIPSRLLRLWAGDDEPAVELRDDLTRG